MKNASKNTPANYAAVAVLAREVAVNLLERLDVVAIKPQRILDLGSRVGFCLPLLKKRYPDATLIAVDPDPVMLTYAKQTHSPVASYALAAESARLPFASQSMDLIVANLCLPWCADIKNVFQEWRRVLRPEGLLMFTSYGPDTVIELREQVISLPTLVDMHDVGDALVQAGLLDPVLDVEQFTLRYREKEQLQEELQITEMISPDVMLNDQTSLALTYEVIYDHAWGPQTAPGYAADAEGVVRIPLSHLRGHR